VTDDGALAEALEEPPVDPPGVYRMQQTLITEMIALREALRIERRHKRLLYTAVVALVALAAFTLILYGRLDDTVRQTNENVARISENAREDVSRQAEYVKEVCAFGQGLLNAIIVEQPPAANLVQQ